MLCAFNVALLAYLWMAFPGNKHRRPWAGKDKKKHMGLFIERTLDFSPEQSEHFEALRTEHFQSAYKKEEAIQKLRNQLYAIIGHNGLDSARHIMDSIRSVENELEWETFLHFQKVRQLCKPNQKERFDSLILKAIQSKHKMRHKFKHKHLKKKFKHKNKHKD